MTLTFFNSVFQHGFLIPTSTYLKNIFSHALANEYLQEHFMIATAKTFYY